MSRVKITVDGRKIEVSDETAQEIVRAMEEEQTPKLGEMWGGYTFTGTFLSYVLVSISHEPHVAWASIDTDGSYRPGGISKGGEKTPQGALSHLKRHLMNVRRLGRAKVTFVRG